MADVGSCSICDRSVVRVIPPSQFDRDETPNDVAIHYPGCGLLCAACKRIGRDAPVARRRKREVEAPDPPAPRPGTEAHDRATINAYRSDKIEAIKAFKDVLDDLPEEDDPVIDAIYNGRKVEPKPTSPEAPRKEDSTWDIVTDEDV